LLVNQQVNEWSREAALKLFAKTLAAQQTEDRKLLGREISASADVPKRGRMDFIG